MSLDLMLIGGVVILALSLPALVTAMISRQSMKYPLAVGVLGTSFVMFATTVRPGGYTFEEIPAALGRVAGLLFG